MRGSKEKGTATSRGAEIIQAFQHKGFCGASGDLQGLHGNLWSPTQNSARPVCSGPNASYACVGACVFVAFFFLLGPG